MVRESPSKASLGRGNGNGTFTQLPDLATGVASPSDCAVADLNGDGRLDIVMCGTDSCAVLLHDPVAPASFLPPEPLLLQRGVRVAAADLDGDGRCDIVTCGADGCEVALQSPSTRGRFLPSFALSTEHCGGLAIGDVNGDGIPDCCWVEVDTGLLRCENADPDDDSPPAVRLNGLPPGVPVTGTILLEADTDGDGAPEIWVACPDGSGLSTGSLRKFSTH